MTTPRHTPVGGLVRSSGRTPAGGARAQVPLSDLTGDTYIRRAGRQLIVSIYGAMRVIRLYPPENEAVRNALSDLAQSAQDLLEREHEVELRASNEFIFVNSTRLRLDLDNYASFSQILSVLRAVGVGSVRLSDTAQARDWLVFLSLLLSQSKAGDDVTAFDLTEKLAAAGVTCFELGAPLVTEDDTDFRQRAKEAAKRTYSQSVAVTKEVMNSVRMGASPNIKKIKRVV